jgi:hypothetical protein
MAITQSFTQAGLSNPYSQLYYSYPEEDARIDKDAMNRARQFSSQSAAARGSTSPRGAALNTYNRLSSDYTLGKAQQDRSNRLAYTQTMANMMAQPGATKQSTLASIGGPVGSALLGAGKEDLYKGLKKLGSSLWGSSPEQLTQQYEGLQAGNFGGYGYGDQPFGDMSGMMDSPYSGLMSQDFSELSGAYQPEFDWSGALQDIPYDSFGGSYEMPDFSEAYQNIPSLW